MFFGLPSCFAVSGEGAVACPRFRAGAVFELLALVGEGVDSSILGVSFVVGGVSITVGGVLFDVGEVLCCMGGVSLDLGRGISGKSGSILTSFFSISEP